jgi:hypothetical protein
VPTYDAKGYTEFVQDAQRSTIKNYKITGWQEVTVASRRTTSEYDFGQTSIGADISGGWFSPWSASGAHSVTSEKFSTTAAASSIRVNMTWGDIKAIPVKPGQW